MSKALSTAIGSITCKLIHALILVGLSLAMPWSNGDSSLQAGFVIDIDNATMNPNRTISVSIYGRSNDPFTPVRIAGFDLQFQIIDRTNATLGAAPTGTLNFAANQSDLDPSESDFIFAGTNDKFYATRDTNNPLLLDTGASNTGFAERTITTRVLLAKVELTQIQPLADPSARGVYELVFNAGNSQIYDSNFDPVVFSAGQSGLVSLQISAVPEPSMLGLAIAGLLPMIHLQRRRKSRRRLA